MNLKILCARLAWTAIMTPLIYIFTDQLPHLGSFPLVSFCCFSAAYPSDAQRDHLPPFVAVHVPQQRRGCLQDAQGQLLCQGWEPPAMELKWLCVERKRCAGDGCQALGGEVSPKSMDEPIPLHKRGRKALAIQGSSAWGGGCGTHNSLPRAPFLHFQVGYHPVMHPSLRESHGLCVVLTSLAE